MYKYKTDDGEVITLDFQDFMAKDSCGMIELDDGRLARRIGVRSSRRSTSNPSGNAKIVSDSLGFTESQLKEFEDDRVKHGFSGVEFVRDPAVPQFYQVHVGSVKEWRKYMKHRGYADHNSRNGSHHAISEEEFEKLKKRFS